MRQLVGEDVRKERIKIEILALACRQHFLCDGLENGAELCLLHVLQHHPLAPLLLNHALIVWQIVGSGLYSVITVTSTKNLVYDANRRQCSQFGIAVLWIFREVVLELLQVLGKRG